MPRPLRKLHTCKQTDGSNIIHINSNSNHSACFITSWLSDVITTLGIERRPSEHFQRWITGVFPIPTEVHECSMKNNHYRGKADQQKQIHVGKLAACPGAHRRDPVRQTRGWNPTLWPHWWIHSAFESLAVERGNNLKINLLKLSKDATSQHAHIPSFTHDSWGIFDWWFIRNLSPSVLQQ